MRRRFWRWQARRFGEIQQALSPRLIQFVVKFLF
jgi:hypothetical protein